MHYIAVHMRIMQATTSREYSSCPIHKENQKQPCTIKTSKAENCTALKTAKQPESLPQSTHRPPNPQNRYCHSLPPSYPMPHPCLTNDAAGICYANRHRQTSQATRVSKKERGAGGRGRGRGRGPGEGRYTAPEVPHGSQQAAITHLNLRICMVGNKEKTPHCPPSLLQNIERGLVGLEEGAGSINITKAAGCCLDRFMV